jgi:hypothetical protein
MSDKRFAENVMQKINVSRESHAKQYGFESNPLAGLTEGVKNDIKHKGAAQVLPWLARAKPNNNSLGLFNVCCSLTEIGTVF